MQRRDILAIFGASAAVSLASAAPASAFSLFGKAAKNKISDGPVDNILVEKSKRRMFLRSGRDVVKAYHINLGFTPQGAKQFKNDGRTPEGSYHITHRNPYSQYHLSLGVSYPSRADRDFARRHGRDPGGDIFIHGTGQGPGWARNDWTRGCIAVADQEMEEIYKLVAPGCRITIKA